MTIPHSGLPDPRDWTPQMALSFMAGQYEAGHVSGTKAVVIAYDPEGNKLSYAQAGMNPDELIAVAERFKYAILTTPPDSEAQ